MRRHTHLIARGRSPRVPMPLHLTRPHRGRIHPSHKPICVICGFLFSVYLRRFPRPPVFVLGVFPCRDSYPEVPMSGDHTFHFPLYLSGCMPGCRTPLSSAPLGVHVQLSPVPGGHTPRRGELCITVGASPGGRRTYGPETPTHPARRAALRNLNQQEDFRRRGRIRSSPQKNLRSSAPIHG